LDVHAHLRMPGLQQLEPERPHAGEAAVALAHDAGDLARGLDARAGEVDVERDQRAAGADDDAACRRMELWRAEVRREVAFVDPPLQLLRPAAPVERRSAPGRELPVEERRQPELGADLPCDL